MLRFFFLISFCFSLNHSFSQNVPNILLEDSNLFESLDDLLLIDNSKTKAGRDFYEQFYTNWQNTLIDTTELNIATYLKTINTDLIVVIDELPGMGNTTLVSLTIDDLTIWRQNLQPKSDLIEFLAQNAILYIIDYIVNYSEYMEQLKNEDQNGTY
jgi:hypothetical protein